MKVWFALGLAVVIVLWGCPKLPPMEIPHPTKEASAPAGDCEYYEYLVHLAETIKLSEVAIGEMEALTRALESSLALAPSNREHAGQSRKGVSDLKTEHAKLVREYNDRTRELNYRFCERAGLPAGETEVLPRFFAFR